MSETDKNIEINLHHDITLSNLHSTKVYRAGSRVKVPKEVADQLMEMDHDAGQSDLNRVRNPQTFSAPVGVDPLTGQRMHG